jgi:deoxyadenosine/deoxycytidine kinase
MHIAIAGNIGSGKTTLAGLLAKHYGWTPHYEDVDDNPYLNDFYEDMLRWSFNLQIYFLNSRFSQILEIRKSDQTIVQDRTIYEDAYIFANYSSLFKMMSSLVQPPDLLLYLRASVPTLVNQIQKRGREYESSIRIDYLKRLNERYEAWMETYSLGKVLIIEADHYNFPNNKDHLSEVIDKINAELHGLF